MYLSDAIKKELDYFRRLHEHYSIHAGKKQISIKNADEKILYILTSASYAMDIFEGGAADRWQDKGRYGNNRNSS